VSSDVGAARGEAGRAGCKDGVDMGEESPGHSVVSAVAVRGFIPHVSLSTKCRFYVFCDYQIIMIVCFKFLCPIEFWIISLG